MFAKILFKIKKECHVIAQKEVAISVFLVINMETIT